MIQTDDLMNKLNEVLNDEESMKQIKELASMLGADDSSDNTNPPFDISKILGGETQNNTESDNAKLPASPAPDIDIGKIMKLKGMIEASGKSDKNVALLLALKPLLKEEKQAKVDQVIKILRLLTMLPLLKESGLLGGDFLGIL